MSRKSRKPRHAPRPSRQSFDAVHFRDPDGNERSVCNAEERATYSGEVVVCTTVLADVTCRSCQSTPAFARAMQRKVLKPTLDKIASAPRLSELMTRAEREAEAQTRRDPQLDAHLRSVGAVDENGRPDPAFYRPGGAK